MCSPIAVFFGKAKVDDVHQVALLAKPHQEVVGLDVTVNETARMDKVSARDELVSKQ